MFTSIGSSYEECRAECVGLHLCLEPGVCEIFGHAGADIEDIKYCNWLSMVLAGVKGLEMFSPAAGEWKQAHSQARYKLSSDWSIIIQYFSLIGQSVYSK